MYQLISRPTWIEIDLVQFGKNLEIIKNMSNGKILWPAVKADSYNHGMKELFPVFIKHGITHFCVAYVDEALYLQKLADSCGVAIEILIFGDIPASRLNVVRNNWHITIAHDFMVQLIDESTHVPSLNVQIKIDSGMNRRGFKTKKDFEATFEQLQQNERITITGIYTHFATADDDPNETFKFKQLTRFADIIGKRSLEVQYLHCQNSFGLQSLQNDVPDVFNSARPGAICYGLSVDKQGIKPIAKLKTEIFEVKAIQPGEFVGYNIVFQAKRPGYIAVLPIGYADGVFRSNTGGYVAINGNTYPVVGRVCMEQTMIYAETLDDFVIGNEVEIFGETVTMQAYAAHNGTIDYEAICALSDRINRTYIVE